MKKIIVILGMMLLIPIVYGAFGCDGDSCVPYLNQSNLLRWYPMNGTGGNFKDFSATGHDLTTTAIAPTFDADCPYDNWGDICAKMKSGGADADAYYYDRTSKNDLFAGDYTMCGWFKGSDQSGEEQHLWRGARYGAADNYDWTVRYYSNSNSLEWYNEGAGYATSVELAQNKWLFVCMVKNSSSGYTFIDGQFHTKGTVNSGSSTNTELQINAQVQQSTADYNMWSGNRTDTSFWSIALIGDEIQCLYNGTNEDGTSCASCTPSFNNVTTTQNITCLINNTMMTYVTFSSEDAGGCYNSTSTEYYNITGDCVYDPAVSFYWWQDVETNINQPLMRVETDGDLQVFSNVTADSGFFGEDDVQEGKLKIYGDDDTTGGEIEIFNSANEDASKSSYTIRADTNLTFLYDDGIAGYLTTDGNFMFVNDILPSDTGNVDIGDSVNYWGEINYKTLQDRGCLGFFDVGVDMPTGERVSDLESFTHIKARVDDKLTVYGKPMLNYSTFPNVSYVPADGRPGSEPAIEMTSIFSIMIGAFKEIKYSFDDRITKEQELEARIEVLEAEIARLSASK